MKLRQALIEAIGQCLGIQGRCTVDQVVSAARQEHPELFLQESERLIWKAARRETKELLRNTLDATLDEDDDDGQEELPLSILPGLSPPHAVAVAQVDGPFMYVRYDCATWADLEGALQERTLNVARAVARREDHELKMDAMRAYLQAYPGRTVAEACELMQKEADAQ